jgi:deoxycytidylate deaminase
MASIAPQSEPANDGGQNEDSISPALKLNERNSLELVIAFTGPVGSGVTTVCDMLISKLTDDFDYEPFYIKVSELIKVHASEVGIDLNRTLTPTQRVDEYQGAGNKLRKKRPTYLADRVIERINALRREHKGVLEQANAPDIPVQRRFAYVIDSLKNPAEVTRLRQVYGDLFWHVTVFAPDQVREMRLIANKIDEDAVRHIIKRDEEEGETTGQQVSKTAHLADYFIRNHSDVVDNVAPAVERFLDGVFGTKLLTPKQDETGMMKAASAAVRSACMSRQVGAAVFDKAGELVGVGCNDVPKSGGGLYSSDLTDAEDKRCYRWGGKICHNDLRKQELAKNIAKSIAGTDDDSKFTEVFQKVAASDSRNLIEFSRSVHAEMEAIVSVAREGKGSTADGVLYTTTFPCHNCARHIVAAGIMRVVFVEPYSKSLALDLHSDAITLTDEPGKVQFQQYEGFAPRSSLRVFSSVGRDRKDTDGKFVESVRREASPLFPHPLDSYMTSEELVIQELARL